MKKPVLLLAFCCLFWACQKKEYPISAYENPEPFLHQTKSTLPYPELAGLSASAEDDISEELIKPETSQVVHPVEIAVIDVSVFAKKETVSPVAQRAKTLSKKETRQAIRVRKGQANDANKSRTAAVISTVLGVAGTLLILLPDYFEITGPIGFGFVAGMLLSVVAFILGKSSIVHLDKKRDPAIWRTLGYVGIMISQLAFSIGLAQIVLRSIFNFW